MAAWAGRAQMGSAFLWIALGWAVLIGALVAIRVQAVPALLIPIGICGAPLIARGGTLRAQLTVVAVLLMMVFALLASFSVGAYYVPCFLLLVAARVVQHPPSGPSPRT